jgi:integrase
MKDWTLKQVLAAAPGRHRVAPSLYLYVTPDKRVRRFIFRYTKSSTGRVSEHGLGSLDVLSLAEARAKALDCRRMVAQGQDPVEQKREARTTRLASKTFADVATEFLDIQSRRWRNPGSAKNARLLLLNHASALGATPITEIGTATIVAALRPLRLRAPHQARRTLSAIGQVFDYAKASGLDVANRAEWRVTMKHLFPPVAAAKNHFAAMDYQHIPAFVRELHAAHKQGESISANVIEFILLTACRLGEAVGMQWGEINWQERVWTLPANRSKTNKEHRVPLCDRAIMLLSVRGRGPNGFGMEPDPAAYVWPSRDGAGHITGKAVYVYLTRTMGVRATIHGFRSSFRDWAGNETHFDRVTCELALAHRAGDATELAYRRSDALAKRRTLMDEWAAFCEGQEKGAISKAEE